jgi:hypothetical protein
MLHRIAEVSLRSPKEQVETVIYPVAGAVEGLTDLVNEHKARSRAYEREKRKVRSSYTNHYRTGLIKLLRLLEFRSNNAEHQPVLDGLKLILRFADSKAELPARGVGRARRRRQGRLASSRPPPTTAAANGSCGSSTNALCSRHCATGCAAKRSG